MNHPISSAQGPFIVYADDDPDDQLVLKEMMRKVNASVDLVCRNNGLEAFQVLEDVPPGGRLPCAIILDLNMPVWNGLQTLEALKEHPVYRDIPAFIFTTSNHSRHRDLALKMGAKAFVTKPFRQQDLYTTCTTFAAFANDSALIKDLIT
jgi:two-component system response regulator